MLRTPRTAKESDGVPWYPNSMDGRLFRKLCDGRWHAIPQLFQELGIPNGVTKLRMIAHRGNATGLWAVYKRPRFEEVQLRFSHARGTSQ
jgi:hypothetical protein